MECKYLYYMYSTLISLTLFPSSLSPCPSLLPSLPVPPSFPLSLLSSLFYLTITASTQSRLCSYCRDRQYPASGLRPEETSRR